MYDRAMTVRAVRSQRVPLPWLECEQMPPSC